MTNKITDKILKQLISEALNESDTDEESITDKVKRLRAGESIDNLAKDPRETELIMNAYLAEYPDPIIQTLDIPRKFDYDPEEEFSYEVNKIPDNFKDVIIRNFRKFLEPKDKRDFTTLYDLASIAENIIKEEKSVLDWEDFAGILNNPKSDLYRPAILSIKQIINAFPSEPWAISLKSVSEKAKEGGVLPKPTSKGTPNFATFDVDISDLQGRDRASVPSYVIDIFNNLGLNDLKTVKERIDVISNLSEKIVDGSLAKEDHLLSEVMSGIGVLNSLARIVKNLDDKAAGWAFESFLAQLANGTTEGTDMGAADFRFGIDPGYTGLRVGDKNKIPGSAKLIASEKSSQALSTLSVLMPNLTGNEKLKSPHSGTQYALPDKVVDGETAKATAIWLLSAYGTQLLTKKMYHSAMHWSDEDKTDPEKSPAAGFETRQQAYDTLNRLKDSINFGNNMVVYIIGQKKESSNSFTADPSKVVEIDLKMMKIERKAASASGVGAKMTGRKGTTKKPNLSSDDFKTSKAGKGTNPTLTSPGTDLVFNVIETKPIGTLKIASSIEDLARLSESALQTMDKHLPDLLKLIETFRTDSRSYLTTGNKSKIDSALSSYAALYQAINNVFANPAGKAAESSGVTGSLTGGDELSYKTAALSEQKITANFLKKLIEESFKK